MTFGHREGPGSLIYDSLRRLILKAKILLSVKKQLKVKVKEGYSEYKETHTALRMLLLVFIPAAAQAAITTLIKATLQQVSEIEVST